MIDRSNTFTPLYNENNFIYYSLPLGKEDTACIATPKTLGNRRRIAQGGQKGPLGWYYAAKKIRLTIGRLHVPQYSKERETEGHVSKFSKESRKIYALSNRSLEIIKSIQEKYWWLNLNIKSEAKCFLNNYLLQLEPNEVEDKDKHAAYIILLENYINDTEHDTLEKFVTSSSKKAMSFNCLFLLKNLSVDCESAYRDLRASILYPDYLSLKRKANQSPSFDKNDDKLLDKWASLLGQDHLGSWKTLNTDQRAENYITISQNQSLKALGFEESKWNPLSPFADSKGLMQELKTKGPLLVLGGFGKCFYNTECYDIAAISPNAALPDQPTYGWLSPSNPVLEAAVVHSVVIVGAKLIQDKEFVYFIDPHDESIPWEPEKRRVYVITNRRLIANISSFTGIYSTVEKKFPPYAMYFPGK